jgi:endonuclease YncB( thermonuclease family)
MSWNMNKLIVFLFVSLSFFIFASRIDAHPGRTAADGCHYCRTNCDQYGVPWNERHCHGGGAPVQEQAPAQQPLQQQNIVEQPQTQSFTPVPVKKIYIPPTPTLTPTPTKYIETEFDKKKLFKVVEIVDGDTIKANIRGKIETIRLLAIDTPETKDPRKPVQCFGNEATKKMQSFVSGKYIRLIDDRSQGNRDKYSRLLRYVYDGNIFINKEMVAQGFAFSYKQYPTKFLNEFNRLEQQAREKNLGLWNKCQ